MNASPHSRQPNISLDCAVITVSDTRTPDNDRSGQYLREALTQANHRIKSSFILADEPELIHSRVLDLVQDQALDAILLNGGTGIAPRDQTYEAITSLLDKELPGFGELFRALSYQEIGSRAIASRATAGVCQSCLIFLLPGSTGAVRLGLEELILPELVHLSQLLKS